MKVNKYIAGFLALFAAHSASAQTPTYEITGATAFRRATIEGVRSLYTSSTSPSWRVVMNNSTITSADFLTFEGNINGTTTRIRCSFNGSIEGLRALAEPGQSGAGSNGDAWYFKASELPTSSSASGVTRVVAADVRNPAASSAVLERAQAEMAFSDTEVIISPYGSPAPGEPVLVGGSPGAVVFTVCSSIGSGITNVTFQQYNSLLKNGFVPKSFFTGNPADTSKVFCTGRNDGSRTRSSYLSEMGFGVSNPVNQYLVLSRTGAGLGNTITALQQVPAGGINDTDPNTAGVQLPPDLQAWVNAGNTLLQAPGDASIVWDQDQIGNGGAASGSALVSGLQQYGPSVRVFDGNGANSFGGVPQTNIALVTWITLNDAVTAAAGGAGANICAFNGVTLDLNAGKTAMAPEGRNKVINGAYSAWNFAQFYYVDGASTDVVDLYQDIFDNIAGGDLGVAGIPTDDFNIGRDGDGGTINPFQN